MTVAEIQQAAGDNPALLGEIAQVMGDKIIPIIGQNENLLKGIVPLLAQKGYSVRSSTDEQSFLDTYKAQVIREEMPSKVKEVHDRYDEDMFNLTGERKAHNEKTYDFLKRKISEIKSAQIADPVVKEQLKTLQYQLEQKEIDFQKQLGETESKYFKRELDLLIGSALNNVNIALPAHLKTDEEKQKYVSGQKGLMKRDMLETLVAKKDNDGNIVFYDGDKPITSTADGKPLQPVDIIKNRYGYYLSVEDRNLGGAGGGNGGGGKTAFATKEAVVAHLESQGLKQGTNDFYAQYEKLCTESGLLKK